MEQNNFIKQYYVLLVAFFVIFTIKVSTCKQFSMANRHVHVLILKIDFDK